MYFPIFPRKVGSGRGRAIDVEGGGQERTPPSLPEGERASTEPPGSIIIAATTAATELTACFFCFDDTARLRQRLLYSPVIIENSTP